MIVDDFRFVPAGSNRTAASVGPGAGTLSLDDASMLAEAAQGIWAGSGLLPDAAGLLAGLEIRVGDLEGDALALTDNGVVTLTPAMAGLSMRRRSTMRNSSRAILYDLPDISKHGLDRIAQAPLLYQIAKAIPPEAPVAAMIAGSNLSAKMSRRWKPLGVSIGECCGCIEWFRDGAFSGCGINSGL